VAAIRILVDDVAVATTFYVDVIGATLDERWGDAFAQLSLDGVDLWVSGPKSSAATALAAFPDHQSPGGRVRPVLTVSDLDAVRARVVAAGATVAVDVVSGPGGRQLLVLDPAGKAVELFQPRRESP
jgi:predicted enzyme related to lactoylglutathione lyase